MSRRSPWRSLGVGLAGLLLGLATGQAEAAPANAAPRPPRTTVVAGAPAHVLGFDLLAAFPYEVVDIGTGASEEEIAAAQQNDQVPAWVRFYDGRRVVLTGYLMPLKVVNGRATKFVMMKDVNTCCYGATPRMNDYVIVTMPGAGVEIVQDVPVELLGTFHVEQRYDGGYVVSLYVVDGEKLLGAKP